jgi:AraC-like DNA-binding protein
MPKTAEDQGVAYFSPLKLRPFLELARESGVELDALLARHGTSASEMTHPETRLPRLQCVAIIRDVLAQLKDPLAGLRASERSRLNDIDVLGYLAQQCPNALAALEATRGYSRLVGDASEVDVEHAAGQVIIRIGLSGGRTSLPELADFAVGSGHVALCLLTGGAARVLRVELARPRPADPSAYRRFFAAPVTFGAPRGLVAYDEAALLAPLERSDVRLATILRQLAETRLERLPPRSQLIDQVRARLKQQCETGAPSLSSIAKQLWMSERTLSRRLRVAGVQFRVLLDEVRRERAAQLLQSDTSISDIAQQLGFGDATTFGRAFRRWTGASPSEYRAGASPSEYRAGASPSEYRAGASPSEYRAGASPSEYRAPLVAANNSSDRPQPRDDQS